MSTKQDRKTQASGDIQEATGQGGTGEDRTGQETETTAGRVKANYPVG